MVPAVFDQTTIDISAGDYTFRATGSVQKFDGYLAVYQMRRRTPTAKTTKRTTKARARAAAR